VTLCGASDEALVDARIGAAEAEAVVMPLIPVSAEADADVDADGDPSTDGVSAEQALETPAPAAPSSPRSTVRLRMVTILRGLPVMTLRIARAKDHTVRSGG
jgi:hypothetical protein